MQKLSGGISFPCHSVSSVMLNVAETSACRRSFGLFCYRRLRATKAYWAVCFSLATLGMTIVLRFYLFSTALASPPSLVSL